VTKAPPDKGAITTFESNVIETHDDDVPFPLGLSEHNRLRQRYVPRKVLQTRYRILIEPCEPSITDSLLGQLASASCIAMAFPILIAWANASRSLAMSVFVMLEIGVEFAGFVVAEYLGSGTFGDAYKVTSLESIRGRPKVAALKVLHRASDDTARARFVNEGYALQLLKHRCIPRFIAAGDSPVPYVAMELAKGRSLRKRMIERNKQPFTESVVVSVLTLLLDALTHCHDVGVIHRDVKDDNILVSDSFQQLWLVDFGLCRAQGQPEDPHTWSQPAADLYAPPAKEDRPREANPKHDVFACGVLAYYLLSGVYPWYAKDKPELSHKKRHEQPVLLSRHVATLSDDLVKFIHGMLTIDDSSRPSAGEALAHLTTIRSRAIPDAIARATYAPKRPLCTRVYRDPLHGDIRMTEFEWSVLNTVQFQRLGYIRQLGTAHYIFRGATHTRLSHAVGTLHSAERIMTAIEDCTGEIIAPEERLAGRLFALVHDIGHIACGHTLEDELGLFASHDENYDRYARLLGEDTEFAKVMRETEYGRDVLSFFEPSPTWRRHALGYEVTTSVVGADVLDYIDRDAYFCGLDERVDSSVFRRFRVVRSGLENEHFATEFHGRHGFRIDAASAFRRLMSSRYALFEKVYCHRVKVAAGAMLGKAIALSELTEAEIEKCGDDQLLFQLMSSRRAAVAQLAKLIWARQFYQEAFAARVLDPDEPNPQIGEKRAGIKRLLSPKERLAVEAEIARKVKGSLNATDLVVYGTPGPPGFQRIKKFQDSNAVLGADPKAIANWLAFTQRGHFQLWRVYVFCRDRDTRVQTKVADAASDVLGMSNDLQLISGGRGGLLF
jgi:HD superfamily phosphohydrolase/predicted Ser/Thr protein kinase